METLNPNLYARLQDVFGRVKIQSPGEPLRLVYRPNWNRDGKLSAQIISYGETYMVNCPFCNDGRGRLYINHRWGVRDPKTRDDMLHLAKCFNEECLSTRERQKQLHVTLFPDSRYQDVQEIEIVKTKPGSSVTHLRSIELPECQSLRGLHPDHTALRYLLGRGFDPRKLEEQYGVGYCWECCSSRPVLRDPRLVIPIYTLVPGPATASDDPPMVCRLAGWQARLVGNPTSKDDHKYLTAAGMQKNQLLYNLPEAVSTTGPVVVVEGITDAWKVGKNAMALLGKTISPQQCQLIAQHLPGRPVVVLLDDDATTEAKAVQVAIARMRRETQDPTPVRLAVLPKARHDPGECTCAELQKIITAAMKRPRS